MFDHHEPGIATEPCDVIDISSEAPRDTRSANLRKSVEASEPDTVFLLRRVQIADLRIRDLEEALESERANRAADLADAEQRTSDLTTRLEIMTRERDTMTGAYHEARLKSPSKLGQGFADRLLARTLWVAVPWTTLLAVTAFVAEVYFI